METLQVLMETQFYCKACNKTEAQEETAIYLELRIQILWWFSRYNFVDRFPHIKISNLCTAAL